MGNLNLKAIKTSFLAKLENTKEINPIEKFVQQKKLNEEEFRQVISGCNNLLKKETKSLKSSIKQQTQILDTFEHLNKTLEVSINKINPKKLSSIDNHLLQYQQQILQKTTKINNPQTQLLSKLKLSGLDLFNQSTIQQLKQIKNIKSDNSSYHQLQDTIKDTLDKQQQSNQALINKQTQNYLNNLDTTDMANNILKKISPDATSTIKNLESNIADKNKYKNQLTKINNKLLEASEISIYKCDQLRQIIVLENSPQLNPIDIIVKGIFERSTTINILQGGQITKINSDIAQVGSNPIMTATSLTSCSFGIAPSSYISTKVNALVGGQPVANIFDSKAFINHLPFPGCTNPMNPTAAANSYIPPYVCIPAGLPYIPTKPNVSFQKAPVNTLNSKSFCQTAIGGIIQFNAPGQLKGFIK